MGLRAATGSSGLTMSVRGRQSSSCADVPSELGLSKYLLDALKLGKPSHPVSSCTSWGSHPILSLAALTRFFPSVISQLAWLMLILVFLKFLELMPSGLRWEML